MLSKRRAPEKDYFSESKRKRKIMIISGKVKLVSGLNMTGNISNFSCSFSVSFHKYWLQRRREFQIPDTSQFLLIAVGSSPH